MASLIHEIENNEALLLMYLSGELLVEDQQEVEQMLADDAGLRAELLKIESAYEFAMESLAELDADRAAIAGENHAIRQAKRAMKQWQIDRLNRQPVSMPAPRRRIPAWVYASGVAAMLLIGTLTYWGIVGDSTGGAGSGSSGGGGLAKSDSFSPSFSGAVAQLTDEEKANVAKADLLEQSMGPSDVAARIQKAETDASALVARSDTDTVTSSIFLDDPSEQ